MRGGERCIIWPYSEEKIRNITYAYNEEELQKIRREMSDMLIHAVISYGKVKKVYSVKKLKEVSEVISTQFDRILDTIAEDGSFCYELWNRDGSRRYGKSYSIKTNDKNNLKKVEELLHEVADKVELL